MAEVVQDLDAAADDGVALERIIGAVDGESLAYVASQRALRIGSGKSLEAVAETGAAWIDGFMAGVNFHKRKNQIPKNPLPNAEAT
ncbi:MAG: hypothetical protein WCJ18_00305 [Planctomycetota bacterium]